MTTDLRARAEALLTELRPYYDAAPVTDRSLAALHRDAVSCIRDILAALPPDPAPTGERSVCGAWELLRAGLRALGVAK